MKNLVFLILLFLSLQGNAAITYFGSASTPTDGASDATVSGVIPVTPPASMVAGDLVLFWVQTRINTATFAINATGGQTWNTTDLMSNTAVSAQMFWCVYNGTWTANPSVTTTSGLGAWTGVIHVYRPTTSSNTWVVDQALSELDFAAPSTPFTIRITGQTTTQPNTVTTAGLFAGDDNTWGSLTGSGWTVTGSAQYRNLRSSDQGAFFAHKIQTSSGATGNFTVNQATLGGDAGTSGIITFYETAYVAPNTKGNFFMLLRD